MLKIKDNVDLEELERFGFRKEENFYFEKRIDTLLGMSTGVLRVNLKNRDIDIVFKENDEINTLSNNWFVVEVPNVIYELMNTGLIEMVEYENR